MLRHGDLKTRLVAIRKTAIVRFKSNKQFSHGFDGNSRIRDAKKHKKARFRDSLKTPPRFRDWNKIFRDPEFSGYHSPPLDIVNDK